ncbi:MAG: TolC family outer membrane protein [Gammaproteobacteria bacterium]|tara:strand:- start:4197 stop:5525 length:1329 start_codon:yes stop_codon:yes gene_type:complete
MMKRIILIAFVVASQIVSSDDLLSVYEEALEKDPNYNLNKADLQLNKEYLNQARSALGPRLNLSGSSNWNEYYQEKELQNDYNTFSYNLNLSQPIFRLDSWFQSRRAKKNLDAAEARFAYQQQDLIIRVTRAYFNILSARSSLKTAQATEKAFENQFQQIVQRFNLGSASKIELAEAKAAFNRSTSDRVLAEGNLDISFEEINSIVGREVTLIAPLSDEIKLSVPDENLELIVKNGIDNNFLIKEAASKLLASKSNTRSKTANYLPKIDANANANRRTSKQYTFDGLDSDLDLPFFIPQETENRNFSVQFSLPLFTSGLNNSQRRQALLEEVKSEEQVILIQRNITQQIRSLHSAIRTAKLNVESLEASLESTKDALDATKLGYELNSRNLIDLLQAERSFSDVQNRLSQAKYSYIVTYLQFKQAIGILDPDDLLEINENLE